MAMVIEGSLEVKLTCRKNASGCGAKHMWKSKWSKMSKHLTPRALLEVELFKKYTPFWRETHLQANSVKNWRSRTTFGRSDVEKVHAIVARSTFRSQNVQSTRGSTTFGGSDVASLRFASLHYITLHYTTLHYTTLQYITLHYTPLHYNYIYNYTPLHSTPLHYTTLHWMTLHHR